MGKHVGEDSDTTRADETIGYLVFETGSGTVSGVSYIAGLGADTVSGSGNSPPYSYSFNSTLNVQTAVVSQNGMDGVNGGWAILYGDNAVSADALPWPLMKMRRRTRSAATPASRSPMSSSAQALPVAERAVPAHRRGGQRQQQRLDNGQLGPRLRTDSRYRQRQL